MLGKQFSSDLHPSPDIPRYCGVLGTKRGTSTSDFGLLFHVCFPVWSLCVPASLAPSPPYTENGKGNEM